MNSMLRECKSEVISVKTVKDIETYLKTKYVPAPKYNIKLCIKK